MQTRVRDTSGDSFPFLFAPGALQQRRPKEKERERKGGRERGIARTREEIKKGLASFRLLNISSNKGSPLAQLSGHRRRRRRIRRIGKPCQTAGQSIVADVCCCISQLLIYAIISRPSFRRRRLCCLCRCLQEELTPRRSFWHFVCLLALN